MTTRKPLNIFWLLDILEYCMYMYYMTYVGVSAALDAKPRPVSSVAAMGRDDGQYVSSEQQQRGLQEPTGWREHLVKMGALQLRLYRYI